MLSVLFGQASDPGKLRPNNEDAMGTFVPNSRQERNRMVGCLLLQMESAA